MDPVIVPRDLTPEAAMIVYNWICQIEAAIWDQYDDVLVPLIIQENALNEHLRLDDGTLDPSTDSTEDIEFEDSDHTGDDTTQAPNQQTFPRDPDHSTGD